MFKQYGHTIGLRFPYWSNEVSKYEAALKNTYGYSSSYRANYNWNGYFGSKTKTDRPYFITLRDEKMLTALLLSV